MKKEIMSKEAAQKEIEAFLIDNGAESMLPDEGSEGTEFKKLVNDMAAGRLVIEDGVISKLLRYPLTDKESGKTVVDKVTFGKRLEMATRNRIMGGMKKGDQKSTIDAQMSLTSELTGLPVGVLGKIDATDAKIIDVITGVFLV